MEDWERNWIYKINVTDSTGPHEMFVGCGTRLDFQPGAVVSISVSHEPPNMAEMKETIAALRAQIRELQSPKPDEYKPSEFMKLSAEYQWLLFAISEALDHIQEPEGGADWYYRLYWTMAGKGRPSRP